MPKKERDICTKLMIQGFNGMLCNVLSHLLTLLDLAAEGGTRVTGGQSVVCESLSQIIPCLAKSLAYHWWHCDCSVYSQ